MALPLNRAILLALYYPSLLPSRSHLPVMSTAAADEAAALFSHSGKLTTHPEDARSRTPSEPDSDAELNNNNNDADPTASSDMPAPSLNYHMPHGTSFDANTGPKGVIADARSFERAKKQKWRFLQRSAGSLSPEAEYKQKDLSLAGRDERSLSPQHMDDDDDDDDDDEFMERWRKSRLSELRSGDVRSRRLSPSMRRYGSMVNVDAVGYLDAIEKVGRDTVVVVCIYDDQVRLMNLNNASPREPVLSL